MSNKRFFLGIDVSTTGSKALLIDGQGRVVSSATSPHPISTPQPLWSEQDPHDWWQSSQKSIRNAMVKAGAQSTDILAIGLTGQMHGLVLLDAQNRVLRPAILWNDLRLWYVLQKTTNE